MRIAHIHTSDISGTMSIPRRLALGQRALGHEAMVAVGVTDYNDGVSEALLGPHQPGRWEWPIIRATDPLLPFVGRAQGAGRLADLLVNRLGAFERRRWGRRRAEEHRQGHEDIEYPATWNLLNRLPWKPDILHLHNLHGGYFDLRALPWLTGKIPTVLTLHDMWTLTGHCAYSLGCQRWRTGCGECPDLTIYPAIRKDATVPNLARKKDIFARSRMYVTSAAEWLLGCVPDSVVASAVIGTRRIADGVDLSVFAPGDREEARDEIGLPRDAHVLIFAASNFLGHQFKDWPTIHGAMEALAARQDVRPVVLAAVGDGDGVERLGDVEIRLLGKVGDQATMARWYRAANVFLHAARADTFPGVVLEALACGLPAVATAVNGIPEQIRSLSDGYTPCPVYGPDDATGILTAPGDAEAMADACVTLLSDDALRSRLSSNAVRDARERFGTGPQAEAYIDLYREAVANHRGPSSRRR